MSTDGMLLCVLAIGIGWMAFTKFFASLSIIDATLFIIFGTGAVIIGALFLFEFYSKWGRERRKQLKYIRELPLSLLTKSSEGIRLGDDLDLKISVFLPDALRRRHVHILGATGSGKTESVILNFLRQDVERGIGTVILDAKGDASFLSALGTWIPKEKLKIFDLGSSESLTYDPIASGSPIEAAQRLFSSLTWSEEYYKSKAFSALQLIFQNHFERFEKNPKLYEISEYLDTFESFSEIAVSVNYPEKLANKDFMELSGLRDQIKTLCMGHLSSTLSPKDTSQMKLEEAQSGSVLYFRLQSLLSPQLVTTVGKLLINHLSFLAGTAHRNTEAKEVKLVPIYLDEFASFACPEFADLISKARSAGLALHFSHQSIGDLVEVSEGFLSRITDNSGTKIVLRINDPDSAEYFARSFGTRIYQKTTQRITNAKKIDHAEVLQEGTQREAHQFRAAPDLFKTLPTGVGSVLIAHGHETPHGASSVFKIRFPRL